MSIPQPNLDDRTFADLVDEARALIPTLVPERTWTNLNPSDPGITLVELFAWLTEMLIYRVNRLTADNTRTFLKLLNGPAWTPGPDLDADIRSALLDLRARHRAVTPDDYEVLAREADPRVARAHCVRLRDLEARTEALRTLPREGHVSVLVVPHPEGEDPASRPGAPMPSEDLLRAVREGLAPRRLLTVRQHVAAPVYVPVTPEIVLATRPDVAVEPLRRQVAAALERFLDPRTGGPDGRGWPFGRDVYVSELYQLLERDVPGVDHVVDLALASACPADAPRCVEAAALWHDTGDLIGLALDSHHLPWARIEPQLLVFGTRFAPVRVKAWVRPELNVTPAAVRQAVKSALRRHFHPGSGGPGGTAPWETSLNELNQLLTGLPEISFVVSAELTSDAGHMLPGPVQRVSFAAGEMAELAVEVTA